MDALEKTKSLLWSARIRHSYPHSWRSQSPLIFRNSTQWFISMQTNDLRKKALSGIARTRFYPDSGRERLRSMIASRPDWCVSRQRLWGVPLPIFVERDTGKTLRDPDVVERIARIFAQEGGDAWFVRKPQDFLGEKYDSAAFSQVRDVVEVWFDSGSTHSFVLEKNPSLQWPADLYVEGSDQHRGWFHSSLLESCGTRGHPPYKAILTHGFVVDAEGRKMSKSLGNVTAPARILHRFGADVLRLWVAASNYEEDLRISDQILARQTESYRRLRNVFRFLLGNLPKDTNADTRHEPQIHLFPAMERWILHRLWALDTSLRAQLRAHAFHGILVSLRDFCASVLSSFYFDVRKDCLYCDSVRSVRRRSCLFVLDRLFDFLTAWLAPILCFTCEEAWQERRKSNPATLQSVHLRLLPEIPEIWRNDLLHRQWSRFLYIRRSVTAALEIARAEKRIGSSLEADVEIFLEAPQTEASHSEIDIPLEAVDWAELCIVSKARVRSCEGPPDATRDPAYPEVAVGVRKACGHKCARCWRILPEVGDNPPYPQTCRRCADVLQTADA